MAEKARATGLKRMLRERDRLFLETGRCYGLKELHTKDSDPLKYERFILRLLTACITVRDVGKYISASPGSREMGELVWAVLTPEGDCVSMSMGLIGHVGQMPTTLGWLIEHDYEDNPGVFNGDVFSTNDPVVGMAHPGDCGTYLPIFYKNEFIGWAGSINHIADVGGLQAGGFPTVTVSRFTQGFTFPMIKTGQDFDYYKWWLELWMANTRSGVFNILDEKMRLAGCIMLKDRVLDIINEFGVDYYKNAVKERLEEGRRHTETNIRALTVPGKNRADVAYAVIMEGLLQAIPEANRNFLIRIQNELEITPKAKVVYDVSGSSKWGPHPYNSSPGGLITYSTQPVIVEFFQDVRINSGCRYQVEHIIPLGCLFNPDTPFYASANSLPTIAHFASGGKQQLAFPFFSRGYLEECGGKDRCGATLSAGGVTPGGAHWGITDFGQVGAWSQGAMAYRDGFPCLWMNPPNATPDIGDAEEWEFVTPGIFFIGRKLLPNFCGHGKYRSGLGLCYTRVIFDPGQMGASACQSSSGILGQAFSGVFGGYPAPSDHAMFVRNTNIRELIAEGEPYPRDSTEMLEMIETGKLKGEVSVYKYGSPELTMHDGDMVATAGNTGSGWGDPLEREPSLCEEDVRYAWLTPDVVEKIYGVVGHFSPDGKQWKADEEATRKKRQQMKEKRRKLSVPVKDWWQQERSRLLKRDLRQEVLAMHRECMTFDKYRREFTGFWQMEKDFEL